MTEEIRKALDLYKIWVKKFHFQEGLTSEDWQQFMTGEGLDTEETKLAEEWKQIYSDPSAALNRAHNYVYTLISEGRESELPDDIRELIDKWNNQQ